MTTRTQLTHEIARRRTFVRGTLETTGAIRRATLSGLLDAEGVARYAAEHKLAVESITARHVTGPHGAGDVSAIDGVALAARAI